MHVTQNAGVANKRLLRVYTQRKKLAQQGRGAGKEGDTT